MFQLLLTNPYMVSVAYIMDICLLVTVGFLALVNWKDLEFQGVYRSH